jgi:hypothetical protein
MFCLYSTSRKGASKAAKPAGPGPSRSRRSRPAFEALEGRQLMSLGAQFGPINTTNHQGAAFSASASSANGSSVVVWTDQLSPTKHDILAQRLNGAGNKIGPQMVVSGGPDDENLASVAIDNQGDFVVAWVQTQPNGNTDVLAQKFGASGNAVGGIVPVAVGTFPQIQPQVAMDAAGDFVVSYTRDTNNNNFDVFAKQYNVNEQLVNVVSVATTPAAETGSSVAMTPDGRFYVAYQVNGASSSSQDGVHMNEYSAQGGLLRAQTIATGDAGAPRVSVDNFANAVVVWQQSTANKSEILARRVSLTGGMGPVLTIGASTTFTEGNETVALKRDGSGSFVVAYEQDVPIFIKRSNAATGNQVLVAEVTLSSTSQGLPTNTITTVSAGAVSQPAVSVNNSGQYLLTYSSAVTTPIQNIDGRLGQLPSSGPHTGPTA